MKRRLSGLILVILVIVVILIFAIPSFKIREEIRKTIRSVQPSDLNIVILTDLHYDPEGKENSVLQPTMESIQKIAEEAQIDTYWNLGDFIKGNNTTRTEAIQQIKAVVDAQKNVSQNFHNVMGNHDNNIQSTWGDGGLPESEIISIAELNEILGNTGAEQEEIHNESRLTDYYVDFPTIRIICISAENTTFQPETVRWLEETALDTDHEIIVLSHIPTRPEWGFRNDVENGDLIEGVLSEFIENPGLTERCLIPVLRSKKKSIPAWMTGRNHCLLRMD